MATWYWKNGGDGLWDTTANWWSNPNGTGSHPAGPPWATDNGTQNDNLTLATGETSSPTIAEVAIGSGITITGTCDIPGIILGGDAGGISSGTFTGSGFQNNNNIGGGTFSGDNFQNVAGYGQIFGGNFQGKAVSSLFRLGFGQINGSAGTINFTSYNQKALDIVGGGLT